MLKNHFLIIVFCLFIGNLSYSQNLIPNGSFEDINICYERNATCSPSAWWNVRTEAAGFNQGRGHSGRHFAQLTMEINNPPASRQYIQGIVMCPLLKGKEYTFSMYVRAKHNDFILPQVYFSKDFLCTNEMFSKSLRLKYTPDISFQLSKKERRKATKDWVKLETSFIAKGNEKYIVIGNFSEDTTSYFAKHADAQVTYTSMDDISLVANESVGYSTCNMNKIKDSIYDLTFRHSCPADLPEFFAPPKEIKSKSALIHYTLGDVNFEFDKVELNHSADSVLKIVINELKEDPDLKMKIHGYTDSVGSETYNISLSKKRARAAAEYFLRNKIAPERLTFQGYGAANPIADNKTESGRKRNRRVEIYLWK